MTPESLLRRIVFGLLVLCGCVLPGCIARSEGCLDPGASNYDLEAERACGDCCKYPTISVEWSPKWNTGNFNVLDTLRDTHGQAFLIRDLRFLVEAWSWADPLGGLYTADSSEIACGGTLEPWLADYNLLVPTQFVYTFGTIRHFPEVAALRFTLGTGRDYSCLEDSGSLPSYLAASGSLWDRITDSRASLRLVLQPDPFDEATDTLYWHGVIPVEIPYEGSLERGRAARFRLTADYARWFASGDVTDPASFLLSLETGIEGSVTATP